MADTRIGSADYTSMNSIDQTTATESDFRRTIMSAQQDTPGTNYYPQWTKWFGYYKDVPEIQAVINKQAIWTLGKGYECDDATRAVLDKIRGNGKDTFNDILFNMHVTKKICGDAFAEIVTDDWGNVINLKPINPGSMVIKTNEKGMITGYTQCVKYTDGKGTSNQSSEDFKPEKILHMMNNRLGDEPHGRSTVEKLQWIVEARNENLKDMRIIFHRYVKPLIVVEADEDDETKLAELKAKLDKTVENMENMVIPKDVMSMTRMSIPQYSTLDPMPWLAMLQEYFVTSEGVPEVILGHGKETTEASAKIVYLAFQQTIEHEQRYVEAQLKAQASITIQLNFPASMEPGMQQDYKKERRINNYGKSFKRTAKAPTEEQFRDTDEGAGERELPDK